MRGQIASRIPAFTGGFFFRSEILNNTERVLQSLLLANLTLGSNIIGFHAPIYCNKDYQHKKNLQVWAYKIKRKAFSHPETASKFNFTRKKKILLI